MLSSLIFIPFIGGISLFFLSKKWIPYFSVIFAFLYFFWSLALFFLFDPNTAALQLTEKISWFPSIGVNYFVGIDGISFWLVLLTTFLFPLTILGSAWNVKENVRGMMLCLYFLTGFVVGSFLALDGLLFYVFFEGSLLPLFFLILIWGGEQRVYACMKFFIYTAFGSFFMLAGILILMFLTQEHFGQMSASILDFYKLKIPFIGNYFLNTQGLLFLVFFLAFAIKTPLFPFHTWLPLAHVQAPTAGSVFLAAVVLKMGTYGFLRFILPLFPEASKYFAPTICFLAVIGIIYGAMMALAQDDLKKLIAYSSVSHMGYVLLGFFIFNTYSVSGGFFQMISHGLSSAGLFFLVGMIYERTHTRSLKDYGGIATLVPRYSTVFFLITLSAIALPLTGGFISEFLVLFGTFMENKIWAVSASLGVVLGAVYMLYLVLRVFFGPLKKIQSLEDLKFRELLVVIPLIVAIFISGIFPNIIWKYSKKSLQKITEDRFHYELTIHKDVEKNQVDSSVSLSSSLKGK